MDGWMDGGGTDRWTVGGGRDGRWGDAGTDRIQIDGWGMDGWVGGRVNRRMDGQTLEQIKETDGCFLSYCGQASSSPLQELLRPRLWSLS